MPCPACLKSQQPPGESPEEPIESNRSRWALSRMCAISKSVQRKLDGSRFGSDGIRTAALYFCFDAFSLREQEATSLEAYRPYKILRVPLACNAMLTPSERRRIFSGRAEARCPSIRKPLPRGRVSLWFAASISLLDSSP